MLETVRQYAQDRLRRTCRGSAVASASLGGFVALAETFSREIGKPQQQTWLARLASEHDNLRPRSHGRAESNPIEGLRLAASLDGFWRIRGHLAEGREWLARLLAAAPIGGRTRDRARGLHSAAMLATAQGDHVTGKRLLVQSLALFREIDDQTAAGTVLEGLAWLSILQGDYGEAEELAREAIDRSRATGDRHGSPSGSAIWRTALHRQGQWAAARELYEQALALARELGNAVAHRICADRNRAGGMR